MACDTRKNPGDYKLEAGIKRGIIEKIVQQGT